MAKYKLTEDRVDEILGRAIDGQDVNNIASKTGVSTASVRKVCKEAGVALVRKRKHKPKLKTPEISLETRLRLDKLYAILELIDGRHFSEDEIPILSDRSTGLAIRSITLELLNEVLSETL